MDIATASRLRVLGAAVVLGLAGDLLLRATPWGINLLLWMLVLGGAVAVVVRQGRIALAGEGRLLLLPALFFAAALAWRASPTLTALNCLALFGALTLGAFRAREGRLRVASVMEHLSGMMLGALHAVGGSFPLLFQEIPWGALPRGRGWTVALAVGRGLLLAVPLLFLFGGLFVAADAVFAKSVERVFDVDTEQAVSHGTFALVAALLSGGFLRWMLLREPEERPAGALTAVPARRATGGIEVGVVLSALDLLFLAFVVVQLRYLFGGADRVLVSPGLTYAEYARRGFFELVTASALALPLLLGLHALLPRGKAAPERAFRLLATAMLVMLAVIMTSALQRMRLYQDAYGLTELRFYTTAFMGWLAVLFAWFFATVLCGRRQRFAWGMLTTGFAAIALLNTLNPDAIIARTNLARAAQGKSFDSTYLAALSADAVPALVQGFEDLPKLAREYPHASLFHRWVDGSTEDWRTWNWSRSRARRELERLDASQTTERAATPDGPNTPPTGERQAIIAPSR